MAPVLTLEAETACHAHLIATAIHEEQTARSKREAVEAAAMADGFQLDAWRRALDLMGADPERLERLERHTSVVLMAVRAGMVVEEPRLFETTTDQAPAQRAQRIRDEGYHAAVLGRVEDVTNYHTPEDRALWTEGWHTFRLDLAAFEADRAVAAAHGAFSLRSDHAQIRTDTTETDRDAA